jgi:hypothetical protein
MDHDAQNASASISRNLRALWRFNWVLVIGACLAVVAPTLMLYKAKWPATPRTRPSYVAETQILVDSPTGPFLRTQPKIVGPQSQSQRSSNSGTAPVVPSISDTKSLVDAANLLPLMVTSDEVTAVRQRLVGRIRGSVSAKALFASQGINRYRPSTVPVMVITAVARRPNPAIRLAEGTSRALRVWLNQQQERTNIPPNQRIVLRPLQAATGARRFGGAGKGLPLLVGLAILAAFAGGAILLDRAWPRKDATPQRRPGAEEASTSSEPRD